MTEIRLLEVTLRVYQQVLSGVRLKQPPKWFTFQLVLPPLCEAYAHGVGHVAFFLYLHV